MSARKSCKSVIDIVLTRYMKLYVTQDFIIPANIKAGESGAFCVNINGSIVVFLAKTEGNEILTSFSIVNSVNCVFVISVVNNGLACVVCKFCKSFGSNYCKGV